LDYLDLKAELPAKPPTPGRSFTKHLQGRAGIWENVVYYEFENTRAIRTDDWKYIRRIPEGPNELYDFRTDPQQKHNAIDKVKHAAMQGELRRRLEAFFDRYAEPRYDLWRDGTSQTPLLTRPAR